MKERLTIDLMYDSEKDRDAEETALLARLPAKGVSGVVESHRCFHDEGQNKPCENQKRREIGTILPEMELKR